MVLLEQRSYVVSNVLRWEVPPAINLKDAIRPSHGVLITGPENLLTGAVARRFAELRSPGEIPWSCITFYGSSGRGKSLVLEMIAAELQRKFGAVKVCAQSASAWLRQGRSSGSIAKVAGSSRAILLVDDLDLLQTNDHVQRELVACLDRGEDGPACFVNTMQEHPSQSRLLGTLRSRLSGGLTIPIQPPGRATRQSYIEHLASERSLEFEPLAIQALAERPLSTLRDLTLLVDQLSHGLSGNRVTVRDLRKLTARQRVEHQQLSRRICEGAARRFRVRLTDLRGNSRRRTVANARGVAIYLIRSLTQTSLQQIGDLFGNRDHSTILNAHRRIQSLFALDANIRDAIEDIVHSLRHPEPEK